MSIEQSVQIFLATAANPSVEPENFTMAKDAVLAADHAELPFVHCMAGGWGWLQYCWWLCHVSVPEIDTLVLSLGCSDSDACAARCTAITGGINGQPM